MKHLRVSECLELSSQPTFGLEKHATNVSATCFYHLRQLRHIRRTLSKESAGLSAATLVHAFVMHRVDYCKRLIASKIKLAIQLAIKLKT